MSFAISLVRGLGRDTNGTIGIMAAVSMLMLLGIAALTIDMGNLYAAQLQLQAATNAAAMAGANALIAPGATAASAQAAASNWATTYKVPNVTMTGVTATTSCVGSSTVSGLPNCTSATVAPNVVTVGQTATVPALLAKIVGFQGPFTISAKASASKAGGTAVPLNIIFVLDATQSMSQVPSGGETITCTGSGLKGNNLTPENCALYGIQQVLAVMVPPEDQISLMVFPGYKSALTTPCTKTTPGTVVPYYTSPIYFTVVPFSTTYSTLTEAVGNGATLGCFQAVGGDGSYVSETIAAAQAAFPQTKGTQNVMIIMTDGQANAKSSDVAGGSTGSAWTKAYPAGMNSGNGECTQSVTAATSASKATGAAGGTWVYSVAYVMHGETAETTNCANDTITPCTEMTNIASDPTRFFTTDSSVCGANTTNPAADLPVILQEISYTLNKARLLPPGS
jgi:Flp pilus assembly protein TadG